MRRVNKKDRLFELQKLLLQNETQRVEGPKALPKTRIELKELLSAFNPETDYMDMFLTLFERQMKLLDLDKDLRLSYFIGALPGEVTTLISRESEEKSEGYPHIRGRLFKRFKLIYTRVVTG
ncbi:uncharacterized protein NPIL_304201 [Nephila pilipes]|uniref:Uncharacterized protein n=1 Tax=Nephila pilipes TaxID=299642 RepID=A0A8X6Q5N3_NEPPI|nr:uncharacterized protein NPIL_304201 [Nephila pilipes]